MPKWLLHLAQGTSWRHFAKLLRVQHYLLGTSLEALPPTTDPHYFYLGTSPTIVSTAGNCISAVHWALQQ